MTTPLTEPTITGDLLPQDVEAIQSLTKSYTAAWMSNEPDTTPNAVMSHLTSDAVIIPHHGAQPQHGEAAIRKFWWPAGAPPTSVNAFTIDAHEIGGTNGFGFARGRFLLAFSYKDDGEQISVSNGGNFMMLVSKQVDGNWRISHYIWNDPLPEVQ